MTLPDQQSLGGTSMTVKWIAAYGRHQPLVERVFLVCFLALFFYAVADWRGWLPFERGFQPLRMVLLSGALVLQAVAALVQRRSMLLFCFFIAGSMALLVAILSVASQ
jgi:hypothetical protein